MSQVLHAFTQQKTIYAALKELYWWHWQVTSFSQGWYIVTNNHLIIPEIQIHNLLAVWDNSANH